MSGGLVALGGSRWGRVLRVSAVPLSAVRRLRHTPVVFAGRAANAAQMAAGARRSVTIVARFMPRPLGGDALLTKCGLAPVCRSFVSCRAPVSRLRCDRRVRQTPIEQPPAAAATSSVFSKSRRGSNARRA